MDERYLPYIITEAFCVAYAATIFLKLRKSVIQDNEVKNLLRMIAAYIILVATDALSMAIENSGFAHMRFLNALFSGISLSAVAVGCFYWFLFVEARLRRNAAFPKRILLMLRISLAAVCFLDMVSIFTGWVFFINSGGHYDEGSFFWIQDVFPSLYIFIPTLDSIYAAIHTKSHEKRIEYIEYIGYICLGFTAALTSDLIKTFPVLEISILLAIQILFMTLYIDQEHVLARQERELSESHMAVMLSQIQPHFLYNTLVAIQEMCMDKAPEAAETTVEFADFLRGNLDSLSRKEPISFEQELSHTRTYLSLEQKRFGSRLNAEYDIRATAFSLPALTLQPVVENAVQHGISEKKDGGTVRISSYESSDAFVVTVEDDGAGFDTSTCTDDDREHIGISNVRSRLEMLCDGTLTIKSDPAVGTTAVISIPKKGAMPE